MSHIREEFLEEIRRSHDVVSYVDIISADQQIVRLTTVTSGDVRVDGTAAIRRSLSFSCVDVDGTLAPKTEHSMLTPFGTVARPYRGVRYRDGREEVYPLGVYRLASVDPVDSSGGPVEVRVQAYDLSRTVSRDKFTDIYVIPAGTNLVTAIQTIIERTLPDVEYSVISTPRVTTAPQVYNTNDDPWDVVSDLALSLGCQAYFDVYGRFTLEPGREIDSGTLPEFTYIEGKGCTMLGLSRSFRDEPGHNGVIVTGESPGDSLPPVRAEAWDTEPKSPTYRYGPYGEVPLHHTDQNIKTVEEAQATASAMLSSLIGVVENLSIESMVNPTLEAGAVVEVRRERSHVSGLYIVDSFNVPLLSDGTQSISMRQKRFGVTSV